MDDNEDATEVISQTVKALRLAGVNDTAIGSSLVARGLLMRLMDDPRYKGLLFGETASMTFFTHPDRTLRSLLERPDLHSRFLHGSDYPLPGINFLTRTSDLRDAGFITEEERGPLNEIYRYNPLLFDFVLKRTVRHPETRRRLEDSVFRLPPELKAAR